VVGGEDRQLGV